MLREILLDGIKLCTVETVRVELDLTKLNWSGLNFDLIVLVLD